MLHLPPDISLMAACQNVACSTAGHEDAPSAQQLMPDAQLSPFISQDSPNMQRRMLACSETSAVRCATRVQVRCCLVQMMAPGVAVWNLCLSNTTQYYKDYRFESGTSMAAPHVTGAAALLLQK